MSEQAETNFDDLAALAAGDQYEQAVIEIGDQVTAALRSLRDNHPYFFKETPQYAQTPDLGPVPRQRPGRPRSQPTGRRNR